MRYAHSKIVCVAVATLLCTNVFGDDGGNGNPGAPFKKSMAKAPGQPGTTPISEAEHVFIDTMYLYVPAQASNGDATDIVYYNADAQTVETRGYTKPLIGAYHYGPVKTIEGIGFIGHGQRDAYAAVSLDDGNTWKRTNLSESADRSSITTTIPNATPDDVAYDSGGPTITQAEYDHSSLDVAGRDAAPRARVQVRNAVTHTVLATERADRRGRWSAKIRFSRDRDAVPCMVQAGVDGVFGKAKQVKDAPDDCVGTEISKAYPGDVVNVFQATAGNKTIVVWPSRYCESGNPNYSLATSDPARHAAIAARLGIDLATPSPDDLYLVDMYGVAGQQGVVDYSADDFEPNRPVGQVPYNCLWSARGTLEFNATTARYDIIWRKAERLTSGRRDVNRVEAQCVAGAGCAVTWQEDPEGLRPGQGEGPGEGWSGAVANSQTDVWYSFIDWSTFDLVQDATDATRILTLTEYYAAGNTGKPKPAIPLAMPMRVTDNARCNVTNPLPYCNGSAIRAAHPDVLDPLAFGLKDLCAATIQIPTGPQNTLSSICVTADGLPLVGNIAATRPRLGLYGYDSNKDGVTDGGWVIFEAEESKGLGGFFFDPAGVPCTEGAAGCEEADIGKNIWYYSFSLSLFDANRATPNGLLAHLASHGNILNQPEVDWRTGQFYPLLNTAQMWNFGNYNYPIYRTEIARRASLLAQSAASVGPARLSALPSWKQGTMEQGGPADVMVRRIVLPATYLEGRDNPYAYTNMACNHWVYQDGSNPYYPDGLCLDPPVNLSSVVPDTCVDSQNATLSTPCPTVDPATGIGDTNPILQGNIVEPNQTKVLTWHQCPAQYTALNGATVACATGTNNLTDQSWYNPLDVAKGHRGFLDGDFVMVLYAWSPNWRLNANGHDRYELYVRRSFDGATTWTTLPASFAATDGKTYAGAGTTTCETYRTAQTQSGGGLAEPHACHRYAAGAAEAARNVTQHKSMRITTLDPRYGPTGGEKKLSIAGPNGFPAEDARNPSRFFIVYETGDNTTTIDGEPIPLDLFYSRGVQFGDNYQVWADESQVGAGSVCYPSDRHGDTNVPTELVGSGFCNEYDDLEGKQDSESSEASLEANPGGQFMYGVWAEWVENLTTGVVTESDASFRRVWYLDGYVSPTYGWQVSGQGAQ